ncbi:PH domain-containing protein [Cryptosporidium hominis]|uniref:PH domain-containing protein n=1 Tax=Cryptosporidium hominis TaxID=237895 RepID=A0ABX5BFJ4_CRYHO|nr:PH domain-containing protein [Cryptosporidium hominis]|eukprot:PPS97174.1 PH domain-containing protein [Cryptosporidium hominis]
MSNKKSNTNFTQESLLAREEKVLQDAEIVITTQRARIGELRSELERLNAEKIYWSNTHMKEMSDVIQENTKLRLQLDEMQADLNALRHTQDSTDNLITNLTEALGVAESQLLAQENELRSLKGMAGNLPIENNRLKEENQHLLAENEKLKRQQEENTKKSGEVRLSKDSDSAAIQAVNKDLKKHAKLARDLDFRTEELRVNKMCLLQLESDLLEHQLLVEQQRVEIQRLNTAVEALNREKALVPPVVITSKQLDLFSGGMDENHLQNMSAKQFAEQVVSEITKSLPNMQKKSKIITGGQEYDHENEEFDPYSSGSIPPDDMDIVQYRTMEEQRMLISRLLKGLDQLGFTRSDATCYKEKASDYRWFYSSVVSHSVNYQATSTISASNETKENISPPGFFNLFVRVESGNIAIFQNMEEEVPLFSIKPWKCNIEIYENSKQFVLTRTSTTSEQIENHILYCQTEDEFNRWYYALCYGGFIESKKIENLKFDQGGEYNKYLNNNNINNNNININGNNISINKSTNNNIRKNDKDHYVTSIKITDSENSKNYQISNISIYKNNLSFSNGRNPINTENSKLSINHKKSLITITDLSAENKNNNTIIFTVEDNREYDNLKKALISCNWMELDKNLGLHSSKFAFYKGNDSNTKQTGSNDKKLIPQSINFSTNNSSENSNNNNITKNSNTIHGLILVKDSQVLLYHDETDEIPFTKINVDECTIECDRRKMSILLIKVKNRQVESFYYMFPSLEEFNRSWSRLREGGIQEILPEDKPVLNQICVVCKNKMYFYKESNKDQGNAFLTISPDDTNCHVNSDRNEIILLHSQNDGTRKRIVLDCANMDEFTRWNIALQFGGFINGVTKSCMSKYTFDISLFGIVKSNGVEQLENIDTKECKPIYKDFYNITDYQSIEIFKTYESRLKNTPLLIIPFKDTEYYGDAKKRQIVFLTRRGKVGEVRIIINLQTLSNFDIINKDLINVDFPLLETNSATSLKAEYIVGAKEGLLCVYCTSKNKERLINIKNVINENKYLNKGSNNGNNNNNNNNNHLVESVTKKFPECGYIKYTTSEFMCVASRAGRSVVLRRKEDDYDALSVRCKSLTEYEKWERSMSIAGFINSDTTNNAFLPPITYLFHSLDYDFRKQPILPSLENRSKTVGNSSIAVTQSDHSLISHDDASLMDGGSNHQDNVGGARKRWEGDDDNNYKNNLDIPKNNNTKKLLDVTGVHRKSPPTKIILSSSKGRIREREFDLNDGFDIDEWSNISEICSRRNKNEEEEEEGEEEEEEEDEEVKEIEEEVEIMNKSSQIDGNSRIDFFNKFLIDMDMNINESDQEELESEILINIGQRSEFGMNNNHNNNHNINNFELNNLEYKVYSINKKEFEFENEYKARKTTMKAKGIIIEDFDSNSDSNSNSLEWNLSEDHQEENEYDYDHDDDDDDDDDNDNDNDNDDEEEEEEEETEEEEKEKNREEEDLEEEKEENKNIMNTNDGNRREREWELKKKKKYIIKEKELLSLIGGESDKNSYYNTPERLFQSQAKKYQKSLNSSLSSSFSPNYSSSLNLSIEKRKNKNNGKKGINSLISTNKSSNYNNNINTNTDHYLQVNNTQSKWERGKNGIKSIMNRIRFKRG